MIMQTVAVLLLLGLAACMLKPGSSVTADSFHNVFPDEKFITDLIPIDSQYSFFFWLFKARDKNPTAPVLLFLQGGPGTSGVEAALFENGPYRVNNDQTVRRVAHSLSNNTDVLYVDQPIGTGFSTCTNIMRLVIDEVQVATDLYNFLVGFMNRYPEYRKRPMYVMGQSYGGHFIPGALPLIIDRHNSDINIKGVAIGNGHINPSVQFPQYAEYAYQNKLINLVIYEAAKESLALCKFYLNMGLAFIQFIELYCTGTYNTIVGVMPLMRFNPYDIREACHNQPACYDYSHLVGFMKKPEVLKELHVGDRAWKIASLEIIMALRLDFWRDYSAGVTYFLEHGIPVVLYYGKFDFVCNYFGGIETIRSLKWGGAEKLLKQNYKEWVVDGKHMGDYKHYDKLTYLEVFDAGHMATMDNPRLGLDILNRLIKGIE